MSDFAKPVFSAIVRRALLAYDAGRHTPEEFSSELTKIIPFKMATLTVDAVYQFCTSSKEWRIKSSPSGGCLLLRIGETPDICICMEDFLLFVNMSKPSILCILSTVKVKLIPTILNGLEYNPHMIKVAGYLGNPMAYRWFFSQPECLSALCFLCHDGDVFCPFELTPDGYEIHKISVAKKTTFFLMSKTHCYENCLLFMDICNLYDLDETVESTVISPYTQRF